jgi:RimJ/RimL family protein N-acetyltransferase
MSSSLPTTEEYTDKCGQKLVIRPAVPNDASALIAVKKSYIEGSDTIPLLVSEYKNSLEQEKALIERLNSSENSILLIAEQDGKIIGNVDLIGSERSRTSHTAMLGIGLLLEARNRGIGSIMMKAAIDWARKNPALELIWLDTYSSNLTGITLYNKIGFKAAGVVPSFFKQNGQAHSKVQMYLPV